MVWAFVSSARFPNKAHPQSIIPTKHQKSRAAELVQPRRYNPEDEEDVETGLIKDQKAPPTQVYIQIQRGYTHEVPERRLPANKIWFSEL